MFYKTEKIGSKLEFNITDNNHINFNSVVFDCSHLLKDRTSTSIDNIIITSESIYIVEAKNLSGNVDVNLHLPYWEYGKYSKKYKTSINPIKQNLMHSKAFLKEIKNNRINIENLKVKSVCVVGKNANIKRPNYLKNTVFTEKEFKSLLVNEDRNIENKELINFLFNKTMIFM